MAYQITSESYGRRLPKITATATSTDDLATLGTDWAEGSTCVVGSTTYSLDKVKGWVEPGSGGGGGGGFVVNLSESGVLDKTWKEIYDAISAGGSVFVKYPDNTDPQYGFEKKLSAVGMIYRDMGTEVGEKYVINDYTGGAFAANEETGYPVKE